MEVVPLFRVSVLATAFIATSSLHAQEFPNSDASRANDTAIKLQGEQAEQALQGEVNTEADSWMKWEKQLEQQLSQLAEQEKKAIQDEQKASEALTAASNSLEAERTKPTKQEDLFAEQKKMAGMENVLEHCKQQDLQAGLEEHRLQLERLSKQVDLWAIKALLKSTQTVPIQNSQSTPGSNP